jgi:hypothetical protein
VPISIPTVIFDDIEWVLDGKKFAESFLLFFHFTTMIEAFQMQQTVDKNKIQVVSSK